jgi:hypothetical protein
MVRRQALSHRIVVSRGFITTPWLQTTTIDGRRAQLTPSG